MWSRDTCNRQPWTRGGRDDIVAIWVGTRYFFLQLLSIGRFFLIRWTGLYLPPAAYVWWLQAGGDGVFFHNSVTNDAWCFGLSLSRCHVSRTWLCVITCKCLFVMCRMQMEQAASESQQRVGYEIWFPASLPILFHLFLWMLLMLSSGFMHLMSFLSVCVQDLQCFSDGLYSYWRCPPGCLQLPVASGSAPVPRAVDVMGK